MSFGGRRVAVCFLRVIDFWDLKGFVMPSLFHSVAVNTQTVSATGVFTHDLAVNPLSVVHICLRPLNDNAPLNTFAKYFDVCKALTLIRILYRGMAVVAMTGADLAALNWFRHGICPREANPLDTDGVRRCVVLPVLFGRFPFDPHSCFPASRRGELTLELSLNLSGTGYKSMTYTVETDELLDAVPVEYERRVSINTTFAAIGSSRVLVPTTNVLRGVLGFGTTGFSGATPAPTLGRMMLLRDNQQVAVASTDFEVNMAACALLGRGAPPSDAHSHRVDATGGTTQATFAAGPSGSGTGGWENYAFMDFDPLRDDTYSIETANSTSVQLDVTCKTADAARFIPIERILV